MAVLCLLPVSLTAQTSIDSIARRLKPGQVVRLRSESGQHVEGRFARYVPDPPTLQLAEQGAPLSAAMIDSLWTRGTGARTGAIIGGVVVGVPSFVYWETVCVLVRESNCDRQGTVIALTAAGAGVGALLGAAIGSRFPRWRLRYVRPTVDLRLPSSSDRRVSVGISLQFTTRIP